MSSVIIAQHFVFLSWCASVSYVSCHKMFSVFFCEKRRGKATVIRYLVTVLRDRERRSFLHLLHFFQSFFSVYNVLQFVVFFYYLFNRKQGSRECPAWVISSKIWPPSVAKVSISSKGFLNNRIYHSLYISKIYFESIILVILDNNY